MRLPIPDDARCLGCRYMLRGLEHPVCPECGRAFDPADPATYLDPQRRQEFWARVQSILLPGPATARETVETLLLSLLLIIIAAASPSYVIRGHISNDSFVPLYVLPAIMLLYELYRFLVRRAARNSGNNELLERFHQTRKRARITLTCALLLAVIPIYPWPVALRFLVSWPAVQAAASDYEHGARRDLHPGWIGCERVEYIFGYTRGFVFFRVGRDGAGFSGFVRRTTNREPEYGRVTHRRWIAPGWYFECW